MSNGPAYGLWSLVVLNSLMFIIFAFSFTKPRSPHLASNVLIFGGFILLSSALNMSHSS